MQYLLITILLNVIISAIFKLFPRYKIDVLPAIVVNYIVCVITGSLFIGRVPFTTATLHASWMPVALLTGGMFITLFNLLAIGTRVDGITTTTIANKLSLVIPALFSVFLYKEQVGTGKAIGILLAFPAVYLTTRVKGENNKPQNLLLPAIIFIGGGLLDTLMKYVQAHYLPTSEIQATYTVMCFASAANLGIIYITIRLFMGKEQLNWRSVVAGICVGVPNYFSIYYLIRTLNTTFLQSSAIIPVLNIGIVVASTLTAIIVFREKTSPLRNIGMALSVIAILLIAFGDR